MKDSVSPSVDTLETITSEIWRFSTAGPRSGLTGGRDEGPCLPGTSKELHQALARRLGFSDPTQIYQKVLEMDDLLRGPNTVKRAYSEMVEKIRPLQRGKYLIVYSTEKFFQQGILRACSEAKVKITTRQFYSKGYPVGLKIIRR